MTKTVWAGKIVATVFAIGIATSAMADPITFSPTGTAAGNVTIDTLLPSTGNVLSMGINEFTTVGAHVTSLFQANLNTANLGSLIQFANGTGGRFFTVVAGLPEIVLSVSAGPFPTTVLGFDPLGTTNFFKIYATGAPGNDLTGTCFTCGTLVLSGVWEDNLDFFNTFTVNTRQGGTALDQFGTNNYPGKFTLSGTGALTGDVLITSLNAGYFPDLVVGASLVLASSQNVLPFKQVNPSACFSIDGTTASGCQPGVGSVGVVNAFSGPNTMLQGEPNLSFKQPETPPEVPEPATLTLLGFGLVGTVARRLRNGKK